MRALLALLLPATLLLTSLAGPATADRICGSEGWPALGIVAVGSGQAGSTTYYIDDRNTVMGNGIWVYEESNLIDWLQRGGWGKLNLLGPGSGGEDLCMDAGPEVEPDQLLL